MMTERWTHGVQLAEARLEDAMAPAADGLEPVAVWGHEGDGAFFVSFNGRSLGFALFDPVAARHLAVRAATEWRERNGASTRGSPVATIHSCLLPDRGQAGRGYAVEVDGDRHPEADLADAEALARRLISAPDPAARGHGR